MTTEQHLAALLEVAPPELEAVLTQRCVRHEPGMRARRCPACGELRNADPGRVALPVPEATLAAIRWLQKQGMPFGRNAYGKWWVAPPSVGQARSGPDIFAAIRAALKE